MEPLSASSTVCVGVGGGVRVCVVYTCMHMYIHRDIHSFVDIVSSSSYDMHVSSSSHTYFAPPGIDIVSSLGFTCIELMPIAIRLYIQTYVYVYTYIYSYIHIVSSLGFTCQPQYVHTHIHTYIHAFIHTYI